jgi:hypothetical protein
VDPGGGVTGLPVGLVVRERNEADVDASRAPDGRPSGRVQVQAGPGVQDAVAVKRREHFPERVLAEVQDVVVGQRNDVDPGGEQAVHVFQVRAEVEDLAGLGPAAGRQDALEVGDAEVGPPEELQRVTPRMGGSGRCQVPVHQPAQHDVSQQRNLHGDARQVAAWG